jgi:RNA polymerase sigma-70 factor (ECF subfamily)
MTATESPMSISRLEQPTDAQLAERLSRGCTESFGMLAQRLRPRLRGFLLGRWAGSADVDDLVAEAIARAFENRHRYQPTHPFSTWLFTVARNVAIDRHRSRDRQRRPIRLAEPIADPQPGPQARLINRDTRENLWAIARRQLKPAHVEVLWLRYVEQMSIEQISHIVGRSSVTVKVWLFRARRALAPHLADLWNADQSVSGGSTQQDDHGGAV